MQSKNLKILLIDDIEDVRQVIQLCIETEVDAEIYEASSVSEAKDKLETYKSFDLIISDQNMPGGLGSDFAAYLKEVNNQTPFVVCTSDPIESIEFFNENPPFFYIQKPGISDGIEELFEKYKSSPANPPGDYLKGEVEYISSQHVRISIKSLLNFKKCPSDIFINVGQSKLIKVLNEGDNFDESDFEKYLNKSIQYLLIDKNAIKDFIRNTEREILDRLKNTANEPNDMGAVHTLLTTTWTEYGIPKSTQKLTDLAIKQSINTLKKNPKLGSFLKSIFDSGQSYLQIRATVTSSIACWLAQRMGWKSDITYYKLTMAGFMHDYYLEKIEIFTLEDINKVKGKKPSQIGAKLLDQYISHIYEAAKIAQTFTEIPPEIDKIILEHHEKPDGSGMPRGIMHSQISPLGAVFALSGEITDYLCKLKDEQREYDYDEIVEFLLSNGYDLGVSKKLIRAFKEFDINFP
ncbi:response regulator [Bacteriovoracaceae bacterium]|nr:response regulator [Bacteriovoracaceae bacterium]